MYFILILYGIFYYILNTISKKFKTYRNFEFIGELYKECDSLSKNKINRIFKWLLKYNHPLIIERSIKIENNKRVNNSRFTIIISLSYFFKNVKGVINENKLNEWLNIFNGYDDLEKKTIDYLIRGLGDVDFIWGLDILNNKEKIYLDASSIEGENKIYSYVNFLKTDEYIKKKNLDSKYFLFKYKKVDSHHFFLKNQIFLEDKVIHLISFTKNSKTLYYYLL